MLVAYETIVEFRVRNTTKWMKCKWSFDLSVISVNYIFILCDIVLSFRNNIGNVFVAGEDVIVISQDDIFIAPFKIDQQSCK